MTKDERELLLGLAFLPPSATPHKALGKLVTRVEDWDRVTKRAENDGIACLVYKNLLKSQRIREVPLSCRERLEKRYHRTLLFNLKCRRDLQIILKRLDAVDLHVVLLKGIALMDQIYADDGLRPMSDIDIWIREPDYPLLSRILQKIGYTVDKPDTGTFRKGATILDIHTSLLSTDRIRSRKFLFNADWDVLFNRTIPIRFEGQKSHILAPYDQLTYLGIHGIKHRFSQLIWLVDIQRLVGDWNDSDWRGFTKRAKDLGQSKLPGYLTFMMETMTGKRLPPTIRRCAGTANLNPLEKNMLRRLKKKGALPEWAPLFLFATGKNRLRFIAETLFPRPEILRRSFPDRLGMKLWQIYAWRLFELLSRLAAA